MTIYTDLILANFALSHLHQPDLSDLTDTTNKIVNEVNKWLPEVRMIALKRFNWKFATKRDTISVDAGTPNDFWEYQHAVPSDSLKILEVKIDDLEIEHTQEKGYILSHYDDDFNLKYIEDITDPATFPPFFVRGLSLLLAAHLAVPVANSEKKKASAFKEYDLWTNEAIKSDFIERKAKVKNNAGNWESGR